MRRHALSLAAALLIASAGAALGAVSGEDTINGKPLDDVHDIVKEMSGGEAVVPKAQLMQLSMLDGGKLAGDIYCASFDPDRSSKENKKANAVSLTGIQSHVDYMGVQAAASTRTVSGAKRRVVVGNVGYRSTGGGFKTFLTEPVKGDVPSAKISGSVRSLPLKISGWDKYLLITDLRGGLFIDGEQDESFVAGVVDDSDSGFWLGHTSTFDDFEFGTTYNFGGRRTDQLSALILDGRKLNDESSTDDPTGGNRIVTFESDSQFPVIRVVAGDFDGDGIASEIAMIATPKEKPYYMRIHKVSRDSSGKIKTNELYREELGNIDLGFWGGSQRDESTACDIVAGDFDGDGRTELAVVALSVDGNDDFKPLVKTFKYIDGRFKTHSMSLSKEFDNVLVGEFAGGVHGILSAAGDFDGDGRDEMAFIAGQNERYIYLATFAFDSVKGGAPTPVLKTPLSNGKVPKIPGITVMVKEKSYHPDNKTYDYRWEPLAYVVSLTSGPAYGAAGTAGFYDELYLSAYIYGKKPTDIKIYRFASPLTSSSPTEIGKIQNVHDGLIAADFAGESLLLGEPDHSITNEARTYITIVPTFPHHIDYIRSDWKDPDLGTDRTLQLVTPVTSTVVYSMTETESSQADAKFEMKSHFEWKVGPNAGFKGPIKRVGLDVGLKGSYQSATDNVTNSSQSNGVTRTTTIKNTPYARDAAHYYDGVLHIWRYPITGTYADDPKGADQIFKDEDHGGDGPKNDPMKNVPMDPKAEKYYTIVRLADVGYSDGGARVGDRYQPDHDESNLFSYPVSLQHDKSYMTRDVLLAKMPYSHSTDTGDNYTVTFDAIKTEANGEVETKSSGGSLSLTGSLTIPSGGTRTFVPGLEGGLSKLTTMSNSSSLTSTTKSSTGYTVNLEPDKSDKAVFEISLAPYIDAGGVTNLACAVDLRAGDNDPNYSPAAAWRDRGPYGSAPDPSLLLPYRVSYVPVIQNGQYVSVPVAEFEPSQATKLRGVRIYDDTVGEDPDVGTSYTMSSLVAGRTYKISVPIYNASFVDTRSFDVQLGYTKRDHLERLMDDEKRLPAANDSEIMTIDTQTMSLSGWDRHSDAHRGRVIFDWTISKDLTPGAYALCVRIVGRPGDIHGDWNFDETSPEYDPCGNDWGHYMIAVIQEKDLDKPAEITNYATGDRYDPDTGEIIPQAKLNAAASASSSGPKAELTFEVDGVAPMSLDEFRRWLVGRTDTVPTKIRVANTGDAAIIGAYIVVRDQVEERRAVDLIDTDLTSIFPDESVSFHTKIDPQKFLSRNLKVKIFGSNLNVTYENDQTSHGSGSGCAAGAAAAVALAAIAVIKLKKR